ncbi:hypothetical protein C7M84_002095 [Penaeus vannamei]|uniref:Uncharacterized protein n=1 Tax=Penaeus vannamei TaxID=6689 RepID=A0A423TRV3_PENVA|nr:hypothetical protein C7M84_002095 [Penaeus vannamei]
MEDDTTFYPSDLFQVTPILAVPEKLGPPSGSDDTIDILVKQNHEKYGQDSLSTSGDSEMSLLHFIRDPETKRHAPSDRKSSSLKATGDPKDDTKNQVEVKFKAKEQVEPRGLAIEKASEQSLVKDNNVTIADTPLIGDLEQEHDDQNLSGHKSPLNQSVEMVAEAGEDDDCHTENSLETRNDRVAENTTGMESTHEGGYSNVPVLDEASATAQSTDAHEDNSSSSMSHANKKSPRKTPRKSPSKREKSPKKPSPTKSPHRTSKTPRKMLKTPHKSPGKVPKTPGKTPCKKLGKTPKKSPSSKFKEPGVQIYPDLHSMLEKNGVTSADDKKQNAACNSQAPGTKHNANKGHVISPPQIQMLICSHDDLKSQARKREESGSESQSRNSIGNGAPAAPSSSASSSTIQKVFVRRRARRPANFSPTKSAAMSLSCVSGNSAISLVHSDQQPSGETSNSDPKSIQDESVFKEGNLATSDGNGEEIISRKRTRTSISEKTTASKRSRMLSPESRKEITVSRENVERKTSENDAACLRKVQLKPAKRVHQRKPPELRRIQLRARRNDRRTSENVDRFFQERPQETENSKIIVPVKIRRVKRQLNLGLSSSVSSVVSSVPERKSPSKSTAASTSASTPPPAKDRSKSVENSPTSLRRSPRKKLVPT